MNNAKSATKEARLHAILDAATELLVERPTASLNEIADYAGIGIATLHRYVENREQLMLQLGLRASQVVRETISRIPLDEEKIEFYITELVEALIPLGDKIYFLAHESTLYYSQEMIVAEEKVKEPVRHTIQLLQRKGYLRQDMNSEWILNVLYSLLFMTWQQVQEGNIAKKSAAALLLDTLYHGFKAGK
ncbi:TetR/AcrR family transcriptional regulator [Brevibacillus laterosporus]|uniref:TetR/AcrR family transcriptional regulator n=1 Tax=Brevibacillus laterosporus TaxID=1465 RepID=UPI000CE4A79F|nr:TetR/AcrR family transcriptional regulator [Brevibacillus laterosporus]MBG9802690.1 TetR family transcriptional regulator [Brevibacillus laterosporus]MED4763016.1 TetR/AcrR family transcriptional regulator [Brevibacillus laterosporus]PPA82094.1 TetR/AcrR family transcriptional regulator [Brevibacillus laterosporus]TPH16356.1 TetR/AcrR family transcriptional regulator [Brevibacillus laterosporus]